MTREGAAIAYEVVGNGPIDLLYLPSWCSNLEWNRRYPPYHAFLEDLSRFSRLIVMDRRGWGCSDGVDPRTTPPLETHAEDLIAVLDDVGSRRAALFAVQESASIAMLVAASYPQRVSKLIVMNTSATWSTTDETPWEWSDDEWEVELRLQRTWGSRAWAVGWAQTQAPALLGDEGAMDWLTTMFRMTCGPEEAVAETRLWLRYDQRPIMSAIHTPTLVLRRSAEDETSSAEAARYLEEHIPDARYEELPGDGAQPWAGDHQAVTQAIERFLAVQAPESGGQRRLVTVLFTDIVGSTETAVRLGDAAWGDLLRSHHDAVRTELARHRGREVDTAGDGFLAMFDGPAAAIRCALAIEDALRPLGLEIRAGVHTGEVETAGEEIKGVAVHVGARVAALAQASEILASRTVRDLTAGSGLVFEDAGEHELKGVPDRWHLYRVVGR